MPQFDVTGPDGKVYSVNAPEGSSQDDAIAYVKQTYYDKPAQPQAASQPAQPKDDSLQDKVGDIVSNPVTKAIDAVKNPKQTISDLGNMAAGAARGAGSIGATILAPVDALAKHYGIQNDFIGRDDRRQQMDQALQSFGADPNSLAYGAGKLGAEIAGTAGIPGAAGRAVGLISKAAPVQAVADAIASGGLKIGPYASQPSTGIMDAAVNAVRNGLVRTAGGATAGALSAGAVNPDDAKTGAVIGAVIPGAVKAVGALGTALSKTGAAVSGSMAEKNAIQKIAEVLGDQNVPQTVADIQTYYPKGAENIPVSAAAITQNPNLAQLEQGSRLRTAPAWSDFDMRQAKAIADNVTDATKEADAIGQLKADRASQWQQGWQWAEQNLKPRVWTNRITQFYDDLGKAQQAAESSNPDVLNVLQTIQGEMDRLGPNFGPGNLQQLRANLAEGYNPSSSNPFKNAPRDSMAINTIKGEMDDILNAATGGRWQKVLDGYSTASDSVRAADAARTVRNAFWDEQTGRVVGKARDAAGDVPAITEMGLGSAMNKARLPDKSLALSPVANQQLEATLAAIRRQNVVQNLKRSATAGGGSDTISNNLAEGMIHGHAPSLVLQLANAAKALATGKTDAQLARLLSNPDDLAQSLGALSAAATRQSNPAGQMVYRALPVLATQGN